MTRILVCGLAVVDFVFSVDEMPTRAEKYRADDVRMIGGGGGANAAVAIARLGGDAILLTRLGQDDVGAMILKDLRHEGVDCSHARAFDNARSAFSSVLVDASGERQIVNFRGDGFPNGTSWMDQALHAPFTAALADTRWVEGARTLMAAARQQGVPGVVDAEAPADEETLKLASHVAFSEQGLRDFAGTEDPKEGLLAAEQRVGGWLAVTVGANGTYVCENGVISHVPAFKVDVVDTLAAGDVWHGAFAYALSLGQDEMAGVRFANAAAGLKCQALGGRLAAPSKEAVETFLSKA